MYSEEIISTIKKIILLESNSDSNASEIESLSLDAISKLKESGESINPELYKFLDDFDIRRSDDRYREYQTDKVRDVLRASETGSARLKD